MSHVILIPIKCYGDNKYTRKNRKQLYNDNHLNAGTVQHFNFILLQLMLLLLNNKLMNR